MSQDKKTSQLQDDNQKLRQIFGSKPKSFKPISGPSSENGDGSWTGGNERSQGFKIWGPTGDTFTNRMQHVSQIMRKGSLRQNPAIAELQRKQDSFSSKSSMGVSQFKRSPESRHSDRALRELESRSRLNTENLTTKIKNPNHSKKIQKRRDSFMNANTQEITSSFKLRQDAQNNEKSESEEQLNDSELESQMDEFKITSDSDDDKSSESETPTGQISDRWLDTEENSYSQNEESLGEHMDPVEKVISGMEEFYNRNYQSYKVHELTNVFQERIWNVCYDQHIDMIYVFVAKINQVSGYKELKFEVKHHLGVKQLRVNQAHNVLNGIDQKGISFDIYQANGIQSVCKDNSNTENDPPEERALQLFNSCCLDLELSLQIWNVDDRVIKDKDHRRRPQAEFKVLKTQVFIPESSTTFDHMNQIQNMYQDYAHCLFDQNKVMFLRVTDKERRYGIYDLESKLTQYVGLPNKIERQEIVKSFRCILHWKEMGKLTQEIDSIMHFTYTQSNNGQDYPKLLSLPTIIEENTQKEDRKIRQKLILKIINYKSLKDIKYTSQIKSNKDTLKTIRTKDQSITLKEESLIAYYENPQSRSVKPFFLQRMADSNTYLILFPTGLLLLLSVAAQNFTLQAKLQLNLKKDETIIDYAYTIQSNQKNHCIWIMDEKLQLWKCVNEMNPNSCNWTLVKITMFDNLHYKKFFTPAMTFEDYQMTTSLNKLRCFKAINYQNLECEDLKHEFNFGYNSSVTRCTLAKQPTFLSTKYQASDVEIKTIDEMIESGYNMKRSQLKALKLQIFVICKQQNIILNHIPVRKTMISTMALAMNLELNKAAEKIKQNILSNLKKNIAATGGDVKQIQKGGLDSKLGEVKKLDVLSHVKTSNEIQELIYMGKVQISKKNNSDSNITEKSKNVRQFLIRRKQSLEVMFTNGLNHWTNFIQNSEVNDPYHISDVILSHTNKSLIAYYSIQGNESQVFVKTFVQNENDNFDVQEEKEGLAYKNQKNLTLDAKGNFIQISIEVIDNPKANKKPEDNMIIEKHIGPITVQRIKIPKIIIAGLPFDPSNYMDRMIHSSDGRVLMCGRVLIQLSNSFDEVTNIGCIVLEKSNVEHDYNFISLIKNGLVNTDNKEFILKTLNSPQTEKYVVEFTFDKPPISPIDQSSIMYFLNMHDILTGDTSVVKLDTDTLECDEIYTSRFEIVHLGMQEDRYEKFTCNADIEFKRAFVKSKSVVNPKIWPKNNLSSDSGSLETPQAGSSKLKQTIQAKKQQKEDQPKKIYLSLLSQSSNHINIEVICDPNRLASQVSNTASNGNLNDSMRNGNDQ